MNVAGQSSLNGRAAAIQEPPAQDKQELALELIRLGVSLLHGSVVEVQPESTFHHNQHTPYTVRRKARRRTNAEKRSEVMELLIKCDNEGQSLSDRAIAEVTDVSHTMVSDMRRIFNQMKSESA